MPDTAIAAPVDLLSEVERLKLESRGLRGDLAEQLAADSAGVDDAGYQLLKFHGTYLGYDRDSATERKQRGEDKAWEFMIRARIPGGRLTAEQYLALDDLALQYGGGSLRVTTRQAIQFHAVAKGELKATIAGINHALLTTLAACGDVVRNVTATPAPIADAKHRRLQADARLLSTALLPATRAYHEIWLGEERIAGDAPAEHDPLYGERYLPRKFKIGIAAPDDNSVDVLTNDLGIVALFDGDALTGYNLALGGGLGMTHNRPKTYPRLATPLVFVGPDDLVRAAKAVIALQRDHGDRGDRRHARLKYLVDDKGAAWIKAKLEAYFGAPLEDARPMPPFQVVDHTGWHAQGDGRWYYGLSIASGRIRDQGKRRLRTALSRIVAELRPTPILTPTQDVLLADLAADARDRIEAILTEHGVELPGSLSEVARWALACPALPTCGLALNEAERIRAPLIGEIEQALAAAGIGGERISVRITGCPNGCARPYAGEIGIVGRTAADYALFLGGDFEGTRLNRRVFDRVKLGEIASTLAPIFAAYAAERRPDERFGDWCHAQGDDRLRDLGRKLAA
ncbi:MAG: NADPH-dependent assimilatory sulfite reductase hemoprotein subunit [Alphaproteobacteria bacterium]|nr:NADPH-dependent assimilatory sulfite reductase hemoprotein subunit [Alphaproteobacteria bacterium]